MFLRAETASWSGATSWYPVGPRGLLCPSGAITFEYLLCPMLGLPGETGMMSPEAVDHGAQTIVILHVWASTL